MIKNIFVLLSFLIFVSGCTTKPQTSSIDIKSCTLVEIWTLSDYSGNIINQPVYCCTSVEKVDILYVK